MPDERPNSFSGRQWFDDARARLVAFAQRQAPTDAAAVNPDMPAAEPLTRLLVDIASVWAEERSNFGRSDAAEEPIDGPEALAAFAARHEIDIVLESRGASSLQSTDMPAALLTRTGVGRMLVGRRGRVFLARSAGRIYEIDLDVLRAEEVGTVFLVRSRSLASSAEDAPDLSELASRPASATREDPVRDVIDYIFTRQRRLLIQLLVAAAFSNMMLLTLPVYAGLVFDRVIPHSAFDTLWALSIGVLLALGADLGVRWVRIKLQDALASAASATLQATIVRRLVEVKIVDAPRSASAVTMRLREVDALTQLAPQFITGVMIDAPFLILVFALIWMNGGLVVLAPIIGMATLAAIHHVTNLGATKEHVRATRLTQIQTKQLIETVEGLETVKTSRIERRVLGRFERNFDEFAYSSHVARLWHGFAAYANVTIGQAMIVMAMIIGVYEISAGAMTVGGLSACSLLVGRVISPIGQLIAVIHRMHQSRSTLKALSHGSGGSVEEAGDKSGAASTPRRGALRLSAVSFSYPGQTTPQLDNITLSIQPGERVAIIGRSGSGKSTLLKLLTRLVEPERGSLLVDELDARQYEPSALRQALGYMGQTPGLVDDTLLANLTLGLDAVDPTQLDAIARLAGVAEFAARHPQGFGMNVGPRGERLSGGERQSVALARLLLADPKALILDEPTSAMDSMLEARLVRDMKAHIGPRTLIVATHRAPLLELADRLIWLDNGKIHADGPKADVLKRISGAVA